MLLQPQDAEKLRQVFAQELIEPVHLWLFSQALNCPTCPDAEQIARELDALSDKIVVTIKNPNLEPDAADGIDTTMLPAFVIRTEQRDPGIRYYGLPAGYEFSVLVENLRTVSRNEIVLDPALQEKVARIERPMKIRVFVTPTCPYCPQMAFLASQLALASDRVVAEVIEASEFPEVAQAYQVRAVPRTVVNDQLIIDGAIPPESFLDQLLQHQELEAKSEPSDRNSGSGLIILP